MSKTECPQTRRAELFVRADLPTLSEKRRAAVEKRLQELQCAGAIDATETTVWEKRVPVADDDCPEQTRYEEFLDWAIEAGATLSPFFDTRLCYSWETGEKRTELVLPALCLAVYEDDDLVQVAPFARGGTPHSIEECLDDLESGRTPLTPASPTVSTAD
ncbi:HTH domain-containing protein [Haloarcula laminariae]|uniref:HTH domain-containing protein n=1 Tax=Haloarcula laminariae TaxID=2961577 RepID=UPI0024052FA4|nr:HTH domain-containing protein [Halomicroarcula sp. FL173]